MATVVGVCVLAACGGAVSSVPGSGEHDGGRVGDSGPERDSSKGSDSGPDGSQGADAGRDTGSDGGAAPLDHRPDDSQCLQSAPSGSCAFAFDAGPSGGCNEDSECTAGTNGRCQNDDGPAGCHCSYDTCASDTSCPTGQLCVCHGSADADGAGNTCMPGNCRVDSDCGAHGYCSPAHGTTGCGGVNGYYCHTPSDECVNDSDCNGQGQDACTWSSTANRWTCQQEQLCG